VSARLTLARIAGEGGERSEPGEGPALQRRDERLRAGGPIFTLVGAKIGVAAAYERSPPAPLPPNGAERELRALELKSPSPPFRGERAGVRWVVPPKMPFRRYLSTYGDRPGQDGFYDGVAE
jgi:hypothetical protein